MRVIPNLVWDLGLYRTFGEISLTERKRVMTRCDWAGNDPLMITYHDTEWGKPVHDDRTLFEFLILEGAQAGLSWQTVLKKRENYRVALDNFDPKICATYTDEKIELLMHNAGLIRNRLKLRSVVRNAQAFLRIQAEFGSFDRYLWGFVNDRPVVNQPKTMADVPASTALSDSISKDLKKRGFNFVGSTIIYAYLQATGVVNDHLLTCPYK